MAKRMASSADERNTSSSTRPRKEYLITLRNTLVGLRVAGGAKRRDGSALDRRCFLSLAAHSRKGFVFPPRIRDYTPHEIHPDRQSGMASGFVFSQVLFFVEAHPHAASQAGREAHEPCVRVVIGGAGLTRNGMVQFLGAACSAVLYHFFQQ